MWVALTNVCQIIIYFLIFWFKNKTFQNIFKLFSFFQKKMFFDKSKLQKKIESYFCNHENQILT
jgi:hypothetical protein